MNKLMLSREEFSEIATIGSLYYNYEFICFTLENAWKDNIQNISCVPKGTYKLSSKKYGKYWEKYKPLAIPILEDVPNRSEILIHPGNFPKDTLGCILVGDEKKDNFVGNSRKTWKKFHHIFMEAKEILIL